MITYLTPASTNIAAEISPVYAPLSSKYIFSAPTATFVPLTASTTGTMSIAGTQYTTSTASFLTKSFNSFTKATASLGVLFIFQLPAIILFLAMILFPFYNNLLMGAIFTIHKEIPIYFTLYFVTLLLIPFLDFAHTVIRVPFFIFLVLIVKFPFAFVFLEYIFFRYLT